MNMDWDFWKKQAEEGLLPQHLVEEAMEKEKRHGCGSCGQFPCMCMRTSMDEVLDKIFQALLKPKGIRLKLLKWLFPEIVKVAEKLRKYYWGES